MRARRLLLPALAAVVLTTAATTTARKPKPTPCTGTYVVSGDPLLGAARPDALVIGRTVASLSGCPPVRAKLAATSKLTRVAVKWKSCPGLRGPAAFAGKIPTGCATLSGKFRAKRDQIRRSVTATRSACGDGLRDTAAEACDGSTGCPPGQLCGADCTCAGTTCGPAVPQAQLAVGGTAQAGQAVTFDGRASSDADGDTLVWSWSFGDGRRGGGAQVAHVYAAPGQYTARLTVSDGCGNRATREQTVTVAPGPAPTASTTARGRVLDAAGRGLANVQVRAEPGGTATSNGAGDVTLPVGQGVPVRITATKEGYADQVILTQVPDVPQPDAYFEATLLEREPALELADAAAGGTLTGTDGAAVALPANALVDAAGNPAGGAVDVFVTPVNIRRNIRAFPGRAVGLAPDGGQGPIVTYGAVEYAFQQNGQSLDLAPGTLATIDIPVYAAKNLDGSAVSPGQTYPLWSLDPATAAWVQEGQGTVVTSATSPTGLALRGQVTHFSFWNCDAGVPAYRPKPKCLVDSNADGVLEDLTGTGHCWHGGTGPEQPADGFGGEPAAAGAGVRNEAVVAPAFPNWLGQEVLPAAGGVALPVPSNMDIVLQSRAKGGLLQGSKQIRGPAALEEEVIVVLRDVNATSDRITIPFQRERTISQTDSLHVYEFDGTAGQTVFVTVEEPGTSITAADVTILGPDDSEVGPTEYRPLVNRSARMGLALPVTGTYRIVVNLFPAASAGPYRIIVDYTASFPIVVATTPQRGAVGVSPSLAPSATFSQVVSPFLQFELVQAEEEVTGTTAVAGATATFTPAAPLIPGAGYRAVVDGFRAPGDSQPTGFPRNFTWTFNVAETAGSLVPIGPGGLSPRTATGAAGTVYAVWTRQRPGQNFYDNWAARYTPGVGWSVPSLLGGGFRASFGAAVAALPGGAVAVWTAPPSATASEVSVYESRYTPATGWSPGAVVENDPARRFRRPPRVAADANGNVLAVFGTADTGSADMYWARAEAGGAWSPPQVLFNEVGGADVVMNAAGRAVATAREQPSNVALVRRFVPGQGWAAVEPFEAAQHVTAALDAAGNTFVLVTTLTQHLVRRWDVATQAWSSPLNLQGSPALGCYEYSRIVATPDGYAAAAGCTTAGPGPGVFAASYAPGDMGGTWSPPVLLSNTSGERPFLGIDGAGTAVAAILNPLTGTGGQYRRQPRDGSWSAAQPLTVPSGVVQPALGVAADGTAVLVLGTTPRTSGIRLP